MMRLLNDFFYPHMLHTDQHRPTFRWSNSAVDVVKFDVYANRSRILVALATIFVNPFVVFSASSRVSSSLGFGGRAILSYDGPRPMNFMLR